MADKNKAMIVHPAFPFPKPGPPATLEDVPLDVLHHIARALPTQGLLIFEQVNRRCRAACSDEHWRHLLLERFGWLPEVPPPSWRHMYRFQHMFFKKVVMRRATDALMNMRLNGVPNIPAAFMQMPVMV